MKHLTYRIALIFAIMGLSCANAFAQQVKGTVKDAFGEPVIGAAVIVEGTSIGTTADFDGNFAITQAVPSDAVLVVSSIGYKTARVPVTGSLDIILEEDTEMLDETVVVGYGVQKKSVVTAAISSITSDDLKAQSNTRVDNLLQGMTSGVVVTSPSGA
ncbi:MAG: carboxypeptidase-like regulatory domain-containing protein, partial [Bacteroidales bacterium]|nr:carboxypeptidase-like regulatory domain-containing protein [Bacteroidales bacterium]